MLCYFRDNADNANKQAQLQYRLINPDSQRVRWEQAPASIRVLNVVIRTILLHTEHFSTLDIFLSYRGLFRNRFGSIEDCFFDSILLKNFRDFSIVQQRVQVLFLMNSYVDKIKVYSIQAWLPSNRIKDISSSKYDGE